MRRKKHTDKKESKSFIMDNDDDEVVSLAAQKEQTLTVKAVVPVLSKIDGNNSGLNEIKIVCVLISDCFKIYTFFRA